jgi:hypothetical protein
VGDRTAGYSGEGEQRYTNNNPWHSMKSTEKGGTAMAREYTMYINGERVGTVRRSRRVRGIHRTAVDQHAAHPARVSVLSCLRA